MSVRFVLTELQSAGQFLGGAQSEPPLCSSPPGQTSFGGWSGSVFQKENSSGKFSGIEFSGLLAFYQLQGISLETLHDGGL